MAYWIHSDPHAPAAAAVTNPSKRKRFGCKVKVPRGDEWSVCDETVPRGRYVCSTCAVQLVEDLAAVGELLEDLDVTYTRQARNQERQPGGRSAETPVPWDDRAAKASRRLLGDLTRWASNVVEAVGEITGPTCRSCAHRSCSWIRSPKPPAADGGSIAAWLTEQVDWLAGQRAGAWCATAIAHRVADARVATDLPTGWRKILGPCLELVDVDGDKRPCTGQLEAFLSDCAEPSIIRCTSCAAEFTSTQWARLGTRIRQRGRERASA